MKRSEGFCWWLNASTRQASAGSVRRLGACVWAGVGTWETSSASKVFLGLAALCVAAKENAVGALGSPQSQLVERQTLATGLYDTTACGLGESQSADGHFSHFLDTSVICRRKSRSDEHVRCICEH